MLEGKKILITGGTGFFGKNIFYHAPYLLEKNSITLVSRNPEKFFSFFPHLREHKNLSFLHCDVREFSSQMFDYDLIIHAAASFGNDVTEEETSSIIRKGTEKLLDFAKKNPRLQRFLFVSSGAVYGRKLKESQNENMPLAPCEPYGIAKKEAEEMCMQAQIPCVIARCFAFAGEFMALESHFAVGNFISDILHNRDIEIRGDGSAIRSFMYSGDLVKHLLLLAQEANIPSGRIYNVGSDEAVSIKELAEMISAYNGNRNKIFVRKKYEENTPPDIYVPDISKIRLELNAPNICSLEETLFRTIEYFRINIPVSGKEG